jgi:hypothetical protein
VPVEALSIAALVGLLVLAAWQGTTNVRLNRMTRHYRQLATGVEGQPLDALLQKILDQGELELRAMADLDRRVEAIAGQIQGHLQHVGMVRYNAFNDTGGDQSFALAMVDAKGDGAIFNGLFHRNECRVFAKPLKDWTSTYSMSDEELEAIRRARGAAA